MNDIITEVRSFNRFYVKILGLMEKYLHNSNYNLTEARIIFELYNRYEVTSSDLTKILAIDKGYISRIIKKLIKKGIIEKNNSPKDRRYFYLVLTEFGTKEFLKLNQASDIQIESLTSNLDNKEKNELIAHMSSIKKLLLSHK